MFSNSKRLGETRTDFYLWLNIRKLISMFRSVWVYFSIFFLSLSFPDLSQEVKCQKHPETLHQTRQLPCRHCSLMGVFPNQPWTLNLQITYRSLPQKQNHIPAWLLQAEVWWRAWISRAPLHSPAALQMQLKWLKAAVVSVAFWSWEWRSCQTLFVLDAVNDCGAKHKLGTH